MSPIKKSKIILLSVVVLVAAIAGGYYYLYQTQTSHQTLTVGYLNNLFHMVAIAMKDRGVLEESLPGWTIKYQRFASGTTLTEAMIAGTVDIGFPGSMPFLAGLEKGAKWKIAMATGSFTAPHVLTLITTNDAVQSVKDLEGKKIFMLSPNSNQAMSMYLAVDLFPEANLTMKDIKPVWATNEQGVSLLETHGIDAGWFMIPYNYMVWNQSGARVLLDSADIGTRLGADVSTTLVVVMEKLHDENFDAYRTFLKAYNETIQWVKTHLNDTADIAIKGGYFPVSENIIRAGLQDVAKALNPTPHGVLNITNRWMYDTGLISEVFNKQEVFYDEAIAMGAS